MKLVHWSNSVLNTQNIPFSYIWVGDSSVRTATLGAVWPRQGIFISPQYPHRSLDSAVFGTATGYGLDDWGGRSHITKTQITDNAQSAGIMRKMCWIIMMLVVIMITFPFDVLAYIRISYECRYMPLIADPAAGIQRRSTFLWRVTWWPGWCT
jgi:hypothetical protein